MKLVSTISKTAYLIVKNLNDRIYPVNSMIALCGVDFQEGLKSLEHLVESRVVIEKIRNGIPLYQIRSRKQSPLFLLCAK